ncbi:maker14 [Drosophila busckii]|uniref:Maker14 n=1 Tax=Drosophila busckii TaxID=30019 RepID=A0A0M4EAZ8_DROBS|nr:maker14 [Drosophila busckii]
MHLKTSPYTSPIATPTGVIKYERSGSVLDDHEHELRIDSARATPTAHYNMPLRATGGNGNGGDNDDSNNNNDDDDEGDNDDDDSVKPYDLSVGLAKVYLAAAGVPGALGHHGHATSALLPSGHSSTGVDAKSSPANLMAATIAAMAANNTAAAAGGSGVVGGASTSAAAAMAAGLVASNQAACVANAAASGGSWSSAAGSAVGGGGAYACDRCGNTYARPHSLNRHKLQEHVRKYCLKQKKYKCISCEYRSRRKDHVLRHAKRKHCMLYERLRNDEESLYLIRNEDDQSNDDNEQDADVDGVEEDAEGGGMDSELAAALCEINFDLAGRDLTITAVPMLQESEEDDDDYDEDG